MQGRASLAQLHKDTVIMVHIIQRAGAQHTLLPGLQAHQLQNYFENPGDFCATVSPCLLQIMLVC